MKINNIILHNFGSYEGTTDFETKPYENRNIVLVGGKNGAGKTTLFTAMRVVYMDTKVWVIRISTLTTPVQLLN